MKDLEKGKFKIDAYLGVTLYDELGRYYNGDYEPLQASISIDSNSNYLSIVEIENVMPNELNQFKVIQVAENTTEEELLAFVNNNKEWINSVIDNIIKNPEDNGEA